MKMKMKIWSEIARQNRKCYFFLFSLGTQGVQECGRYTVVMLPVRFYR